MRSAGEPILSDEEFDSLKRSLKESDSPIAVSTEPRCYVDSGICTATWQKDSWRMGILYVPASIITMSLWLILSFELLTPLRSVNPILTLGAWATLRQVLLIEVPRCSLTASRCPSCLAPPRVHRPGQPAHLLLEQVHHREHLLQQPPHYQRTLPLLLHPQPPLLR